MTLVCSKNDRFLSWFLLTMNMNVVWDSISNIIPKYVKRCNVSGFRHIAHETNCLNLGPFGLVLIYSYWCGHIRYRVQRVAIIYATAAYISTLKWSDVVKTRRYPISKYYGSYFYRFTQEVRFLYEKKTYPM